MVMKQTSIIILTLLWSLFSCQQTVDKARDEFMPKARGEIGEIILVIDSAHWNGQLGSQLKNTFRSPMRGLPQDEALFSLNKVSPRKLNSVLKSARNMVFVTTLDRKSLESSVLRGYFTDQSLKQIQRDTSRFMVVRRDEFAKGQVAVFLFADTEKRLTEKINQNSDELREMFESIERKRLKNQLYAKRENQIEKAIAEKHDYSIKVPFGWDLAKNNEEFVWFRLLEADKEQNIFIYSEPYTDQNIFQDIPALRDRITSKYLRDSQKQNLFIQRQEQVPVFEDVVNFESKYAIKARGLWKINNNSLGGPFVSYTIVDEDQQKLYYVEGYVAFPGGKKKNLVREVDAILSTFSTQEKV
jgi:hypothetical protein